MALNQVKLLGSGQASLHHEVQGRAPKVVPKSTVAQHGPNKALDDLISRRAC